MSKYGADNAFTLAEVLIVLTIIGIVASMTIPALMQKTQELELKTAWKKAYAEINQATLSIMQDNGGTFKGMTVVGDDASNWIRDLYGQHLKYTKKCDNEKAIAKKCWSPINKDFNNQPIDTLATVASDAGAVLIDGTFLQFSGGMIKGYSSNCSMGPDKNVCASFFVDVNGLKGPNVIGKDILGLLIYENKIMPFSSEQPPINGNNDFAGWSKSSEYLLN